MRKGKITQKVGQEHRNAMMKLIDKFQNQFNIWQVWDDLMYMSAAALSQPCQWVQAREDEYMRRINRYPENLQPLFPQMFAEIALAFEQEGFNDILGSMYMELELGNHWRGQFFTPYYVCLMMSKIICGNPKGEIKKNGFISVNDPTCGGGAMLIAAAQYCFEQEVNYQKNVLFVGQDIDLVVARMCFIQLSLLGCSGYVIIGNSLTQPATGHVLFPISDDDLDVWYTPMFFSDIWHYRRIFEQVRSVAELSNKNEEKEEDNE